MIKVLFPSHIPSFRGFDCFVSVTGVEGAALSVRKYKKKPFISTYLGFFSLKLKLNKFKLKKKPKTFPKRISIKAKKRGLPYAIKHITITNEIIDQILNVEIVLFDRPIQETFNSTNGVVLHTSNAASVRVPENTIFKDSNGKAVSGPIRTMLKFIDPDSREFEDSPGEFIDSEGKQLVSFGVFTQVFEDEAGNQLLPDRNIEVEISDPEVKNMRLYKMTNKGQWQKLAGGFARRKRQTGGGIVGNFGPGEVGEWLNIDDDEIEEKCYVKMRVFDDISFSNEVYDAQGDLYVNPQVLLKVYVGTSILGFYLNPAETDSPSQHCYAVRCTSIAPIKGEIRLFARQTIGNSEDFSTTTTRPVSANNPLIPPALVALDYEDESLTKIARLKFNLNPDGPLYKEEIDCESAPKEKSLWFALGPQLPPGNNFGDDACFVRLRLNMKKLPDAIDSVTEVIDSLSATSFWTDGQKSYIVEVEEMVTMSSKRTNIAYACARYRCSKPNDKTQVSLLVVSAQDDMGIACSGAQEITPNPISADGNGYYYGQNENVVKQTCQAEQDPDTFGQSLTCFPDAD